MEILFDLHTHTVFNDHAYSTIFENICCAKNNGLKGLAITDHSMRIEDSGHYWHFLQMPKIIPPYVNDVRVFCGAEVNIINTDGEIDMDEALLKRLDVIIASFHDTVYMVENENEIIGVYENLAKNPYVKIFGHIDRCPFEYDMAKVINLAKEHNKLVEINQHSLNTPHYRENAILLAKLCNEYKVPVVANTDAHFCTQVGDFTVIKQLLDEISFDTGLIVNADYDRTMEFFNK